MAGIYKIKNKINGKIYIGSTIRELIKRKNEHFNKLIKQKHENSHLQNAYNKYGLENFEFEIIEECSKDNLIEKEQYYINKYVPEYNICKHARNCLGRKFSKESLIKMSNSQKENYLSGKSHYTIGLKGSLNVKAKLTENEVRKIKKDLSEGKTVNDIIINYANVSEWAIYHIKQGKSWKHVTI